ncbi:hypothetical protein BD770DRAFT_407580 [Pilaira anomala]|nr:hypothetical protein BD770DRAFT_407580 [Pilaira anomala]
MYLLCIWKKFSVYALVELILRNGMYLKLAILMMSKLRVEKIYLLGWSFLSCQESLGHISLTDDYVIGTYTSCGLCFYWNLAAFDRQRCGSLTIVNGTFHIIFNPLSVMERHKRISCADIRARLVLYIPESLTEWFLLLVNVAVALELEKLTGYSSCNIKIYKRELFLTVFIS